MHIDEVLEDYRNAHAERRMGLFLAYRELREAFERIDGLTPGEEPPPEAAWIAWERLQLLGAEGSERHPGHDIGLPRGRLGRDLALLLAGALLAGGGMRLWLVQGVRERGVSAALGRSGDPLPARPSALDHAP